MNDGTVTVLVVDDDRRMVKTLCDILEIKGHRTLAAYGGDEALGLMGREKPDCVLMDIKMHGMSGIEVLKRMQAAHLDLPVVMMSANATEEQIEEAKRLGAYAVLSKPIDLQSILMFLSLIKKEESILIVDDDPLFARTLRDILQASGYRVETEFDSDKVLGHMEHDDQLIVVLDLKLGTANGLDVLKEIRSRYKAKPVVLVTGYGSEMTAAIVQGMQIGAYTCLYKPFEAEVLLRLIEEVSLTKLQAVLG
ncbi:response regulator [Geobacter sp. FeAm09]|uniref:response regulator n=1 Tax=Geobacter sp. FeAm09 TaxID=2597769 RepID=UPI0011ED5111|nr:response regulator [Geobacter sp. FeAm09]QEM69080.1 response regulator [Geobacter sp. FeAm09]